MNPTLAGKISVPIGMAIVLVAANFSAQADEIWVTNQRTNQVEIIDSGTLKIIRKIPTGKKPHNITFSPDENRVYVANLKSNDFTVIDANSYLPIKTVPAGKLVHHVAVSPHDNLLLVTNRGDNTISAYDARSLASIKTIPVGKRPAMALFAPDGKKAYVSNSGDGTLSVLDVTGLKISGIIRDVGQDAGSMVMSPDGKKLIVIADADNAYAIIDLGQERVLGKYSSGVDPRGLALKPKSDQVFIANRGSNDISIVDLANGSVAFRIPEVGDKPSSIGISPDGRHAYLALIGKRTAEDPPQRPSGKDAGLSVVDVVAKKKLTTIKLGGDPYGVAVRK